MVEAGGPANQAGIFFQNTVAALYLGRMLDLRSRSARDRVLDVRVEAPEDVDDIVVAMADGSRRYVQAKRRIDCPSEAWDRLWKQFWQQLSRPTTGPEDRLVLVLGEFSNLATDLRECCERAATSADDVEYLKRLALGQRKTVDNIGVVLAEFGGPGVVRQMLGRVNVEIFPDATIERDLAPLWMPRSSVGPHPLLGLLRDMAGGASRVRGSFAPAMLRARLREEQGLLVEEPGGWGASKYRAVLLGKAVVEVPGTGVVRPIADTFIWPRTHRYDRATRADFDDETPHPWLGIRTDTVDLSLFPDVGLDRVIVIAGPGFGKSTLTLALAKSALAKNLLPAIVSLPELSRTDTGVGDYLRNHLNREFEVEIDWTAAAESGLLALFFDGLDEISSDRRAVMLDRIKTFSLRYPAVPWLLTVRDAAALAAPTDALLVELEALNADDISRFVSFYRPESRTLAESLRRVIKARPDFERLARIPLFLAILLASGVEPDGLPSKRAELLESYLALLFRPEQFKRGDENGDGDGPDPTILRPIAEFMAYDSLEREEIGIDSRRLEASVRRLLGAGGAVQPVVERLVKCGVLRRAGPSRYAFPFPVVQEYLAACHILECRAEEIAGRLSSAVKRPWIQALQFVLELHPQPGVLVDGLLAREDDAFGSALRLVGRCVANGMKVAPPIRMEITRRLCAIWPSSSWRLRNRIGDLIGEAFRDPLIPELRARLSERALLHDGAGAIVARIRDPDLTRSVLTELLEGDVEHLLNLGELQVAVSELGDTPLALYAANGRREAATENDCNAMAALIGHLDGERVSEAARLAVALDPGLPIPMRLKAFALGPAPLDVRAVGLVEAALGMPGYHPQSSAMEAIVKLSDPMKALRSALLRPDLSAKQKVELVGYFPRGLLSARKAELFRELSADTAIDEDLRWRLSTFAARYGDADAMCTLVEAADHLPIEVTRAAMAIFGHHRSRSLAETAADRLSRRSLSPEERASLSGSVVLGMTALFHMDMFEGGGIDPAPLHPGAEAFRPLLERWAAMADYEPEDGLRVAENLAQFGSKPALVMTEARLGAVIASNATDLRDSTKASLVGGALTTLRERQHLLALPFLETVIARCSYNGASRAVDMIAAYGSREAFDMLVTLYADSSDGLFRGAIMGAVEPLAVRLGIRVRRAGSSLEVMTVD